MILSMKTRYAIVALTRLAKDYGNGPVPIKKISEEEKIPQSFLENILLELRNEGILGSKLGKSGGYFLLKNPESVTLAQVVRLFEGSVGLMYCVSEDSYQPCEFCKDETACRIKKVFEEIRNSTYSFLSNTTLASLASEC
jgi:Rrf2 family protein